MKKYYTGIGSRQTPSLVCKRMSEIAKILQSSHTLRSGGADGADLAFEAGAGENKEIYIPWKGFNGSTSSLYNVSEDAMRIAAMYHPVWNKLSQGAKKLHSRNVYQILGYDLKTPSVFVLCWSHDGCESFEQRTQATGGTGMAITIASYNDIPVINMFNDNWEDSLIKLL